MTTPATAPPRERGGRGGRSKPKAAATPADAGAAPIGRQLAAIRDATGGNATDEEIMLALEAAGGDVNEATARLIESASFFFVDGEQRSTGRALQRGGCAGGWGAPGLCHVPSP
jgi:hypothetical protein